MQAGNPALRVVFTSGYTTEMVAEVFAVGKGKRVINKPHQPRTFVQAVRAALGSPPTE